MLLVLVGLTAVSCEKNSDVKSYPIGEGLEIYEPDSAYHYNAYTDYGNVDFDTILLQKTPVITYNDVIKYDTLDYVITLGNFKNYSHIGASRGMFVVTMNKLPIYCGFFYSTGPGPIGSSPAAPVYGEFIYIPIHNKLYIGFNSAWYAIPQKDKRMDRRIIDRLMVDGKIK